MDYYDSEDEARKTPDWTYGSDEEYYDAFNDETFGDCGGVYTWGGGEEQEAEGGGGGGGDASDQDHQFKGTCSKNTNGTKITAEQGDDISPFDSSWEEKIVKLAVGGEDGEGREQDDKRISKLSSPPMQSSSTSTNLSKFYFIPPQLPQQWQVTNDKEKAADNNAIAPVRGESAVTYPPNLNNTPVAPPSIKKFASPMKNVKTLEEVERELLGEIQSNPVHLPPPPPQNFFHHLKPRMDLLENNLMFENLQLPPPPPPPKPQVERNQVARHFQFIPHPPPQMLPLQLPGFHLQQQILAPHTPMIMMIPQHLPPLFPLQIIRNIPPPPGFQQLNKMAPPPPMRDPYRARIMTPKDKQRLLNIQILQLKTDHPPSTDYYNLMYKAKELAPVGRRGLELYLVKLYPPPGVKVESSSQNPYIPTHFENCLGQLHISSTVAPRRVIDTVTVRVTESTAPTSTSLRRRHLLLEIEKLYKWLLVMEESHIRTSILQNAGEETEEVVTKGLEAIDKVAKVLKNPEDLLRIISVSKGKMLVCRSLPFIEGSLKFKIFAHLLYVFPVWGGDQDVELYALPMLKHVILHAQDIGDLITLVSAVTTDNQEMFKGLVSFKLGITLLICIYHQAEYLLTTRCDPIILRDVEVFWSRKAMAGITALIEKNAELPVPMEFYPNVLHHIRRFPFLAEDVNVVNSIFQRWWVNSQRIAGVVGMGTSDSAN